MMRRAGKGRTRLLVTIAGVLMMALALSGVTAAAGPGETGNGTIPPGFSKVTFIHTADGPPEVAVEHASDAGAPPFSSGTAPACSDGATDGTDQCDSFSWSGQYWPGAAVTYNVNLNDSGDDGGFLAAVQASAQTWAADADSDFDFTFGGTTGRKASSLKNRMDGYNDVTWESLSKYRNPIAVTIFWYYTSTGVVVEADLINNKNYAWATDGDASAYDVQNIGTHEFGHYLVLRDLYDTSDNSLTMYGYGALGETQKRTLGTGDELGIAAIYPGAATGSPPTANPGSPYIGTEDAAITFDGSGSSDPDSDPLSYTWSFGDGATGSGVSPSHSYLWGGIFTVTLTVGDGNGNTDSASTTATVVEVNDVPVADAGGPYSGTAGQGITLDGSGSSDFDNEDDTAANDQTLSYTWYFGDGSTDTTTSATVTHTYAVVGTYTATLVVSDGVASSVPSSATVTVAEATDAASSVSVGSFAYSSDGGKDKDKHVSVTIALLDNLDGAVGGASISVTIVTDTGVSASGSGTTGSAGTITFTWSNAPGDCYTTTVTSVTSGDLAFDATGSTSAKVCKAEF